jgi:two-component system, cell cycle sensor histidine kinase and response regulator CckA
MLFFQAQIILMDIARCIFSLITYSGYILSRYSRQMHNKMARGGLLAVSGKQSYKNLEKRIKELEKENSLLIRTEKQLERQKDALQAQNQELTRNQQEVEEGSERYRDIVLLSPYGILTTDLKGVVTSANPAFLELTGFSENEIISKYIHELPTMDKAFIPEYLRVFASLLRGKSALPFDFSWVHKDGSRRLGEAYAATLKKGRRIIGLQALVIDVTERKKAEDTIRKSENMLAQAQKIGQMGSWELDLVENKIIWSDEFYHILGLIPGEVEPSLESLMTRLHPDDREYFAQLNEEFQKGKKQGATLDHAVFSLDGSKRYITTNIACEYDKGTAVKLMGTVMDITDRKHAEDALREREEFIRLITDNVPSLIAYIDKTMTYVFANDGYERWFSMKKEEIVGKKVEDLLDPETYKKSLPLIKRALGGEEITFEGRIALPDGSVKDFANHFVPHVTAGGSIDGYFALVSDITTIKQVETALKESDEHFRKAQAIAHLGSWKLYPENEEVEGSNELHRIFGLAQEKFTLESFVEAVHPDDRQQVFSKIRRGIDYGEDWNLEHRLLLEDGTGKIARSIGNATTNETGKTVLLTGTVEDITDRKRAEEALRRSADIVDNIPTGLLIYHLEDLGDDRTLTLAAANKAAENMTGISIDEVVGKTLDEIFPSLREKEVPQRFADVVRTGIPTASEDISYSDARTAGFWSRFNAFQLPNNCVGVAFENISDQRKAEIALRESEEQLRQAQKLESVGRLAGGVAHDFNNILTTIIGYLEIISMARNLNNATKEAVQEVKSAADRAARLTKQLLAFSRKQILRPQRLNLNALILKSKKMLIRLIPENITFTTSLDSEILIVNADPVQIDQVIMNLVVNAADAMPAGGMLSVETKAIHLGISQQREHLRIMPGNYVELKVSDTGEGMEQETLSQVFDPFFTTKDVGKGTGLGLSTVYGIVRQSDGFIWADSDLGSGSAFTLWFPAAPEEEMESDDPSVQANKVSAIGDETILFVEDEEQIRTVVKLILKWHGYSIIEASNGIEALSVIEEAGYPNIDCLVTDMMMPEMGGRELSIKLQEKYPELKTLYISGYAEDTISHHGVLGDGASFLEKPFSTQVLTEKIREMLNSD